MVKKPLFAKILIQNRLKRIEDKMKLDFSKVLFTDKIRVTLDGPEGWSNELNRHPHLRYQQGVKISEILLEN